MGSKRLKAIAVRGRGSIEVAQPGRFLDAVNIGFKKIKDSPFSKPLRQGLIRLRYLPESKHWDTTSLCRNGQDEYWPFEKRIRLMGEHGVPKYITRMLAGFSCPVGCLPFLEIEEGKYKDTRGITYWANSKGYSQRFDVDDPAASIKFQLFANQLGLDSDMASVVLPWAFECYERGLLTKEDADGLELKWGNADAMIKLEEKLAYRQGLGDFWQME